MNVFLDTSALVKLYHQEAGTEELDQFFEEQAVESIYLSEIAEVEFYATVSKKREQVKLPPSKWKRSSHYSNETSISIPSYQ